MLINEHIEFLKAWLEMPVNRGKPIKEAVEALKEVFPKLRGKISVHGVYKQFTKRSGFTFKKV